MQVILIIVVVILMILGCLFVNDTKKKHGTCCGKGCAGCPVFEEELKRQNKK